MENIMSEKNICQICFDDIQTIKNYFCDCNFYYCEDCFTKTIISEEQCSICKKKDIEHDNFHNIYDQTMDILKFYDENLFKFKNMIKNNPNFNFENFH